MIDPARRQTEGRALLLSNAIMLLGTGGVYAALWWALGLWGLLELHVIPGAVTIVTGAVLITLQHAHGESIVYEPEGWTPVCGQLASTFDVRFPRLLEWLWCDISIHVPHHIAPGMPWYRLREASEALEASYGAYYQRYQLAPSELGWLVRAPVLAKDEARGFNRLQSVDASGPVAGAASQ